MKTISLLIILSFLFCTMSIFTVGHDGYYTKPIIRGKQHWDRHYDTPAGKEVMAYGKREYRTWQQANGDYKLKYYVLCRVRCSSYYLVDGSFYVNATIFGDSKDKGWIFDGTISEYISKRDTLISAEKVPPLAHDCNVKSYICAREPLNTIQSYVANIDY